MQPPSAFAWPVEADTDPSTTARIGELPTDGAIGEFVAHGEILSTPTDPRRPWVIATGDRVIKVYDLRAFDELGRARAIAEAGTARTLSGLPGVVTTYRTGIVGPRLIIEMERLGDTLSDHLAKRADGRERALPPAVWGRLLEDVAQTVEQIHRRHVVHRDIKPANLLFSRGGSRVLVGDFSISSRRTRRDRPTDGEGGVHGTDRYVAPELFDGRVSPAADQYALAVTARELLGDDLPAAAEAVLARATSADPRSRFRRITDFGIALRSSVDPTSPHRWSSRLERVKPVWRNAWGPGCVAGLLVYALLFLVDTRTLSVSSGLLLPLAAAGGTTTGARIAGVYAAARSQPRLTIAARPWFPVALFVVFLALFFPLLDVDAQSMRKYVVYSFVGALAAWATLGAIPRDAGEWLVRLTRRWELWRRRHRERMIGRWSVRAGTVGVVAGLVLAPYAVNTTKPKPVPTTADHYRPLLLAARFRTALLRSDYGAACALTRIPRSSPKVMPCLAWAPVVASWMRADLAAKAPAFGSDQLASIRLTYNKKSELHTGPVWSLRLHDRHGPYVGTMELDSADANVSTVSLTRRPADSDPLSAQASAWNIEEVHGSSGWRVTGIEACTTTEPRCTTFSQLSQSRLDAARKRRYG